VSSSQIPTSTDAAAAAHRPLFRLDPGWPFLLAGLALLVAALLIPAQRELHDLRQELRAVEAGESRVFARLQAYDQFLSDVRAGDPQLVRRLAAAQLNMVPKGEDSLLLTPGLNQTVAQWIDESVPDPVVAAEPYPDTLLARLALGPHRLWMMAAAVFLLFVGFILGPDARPSAVAHAAAPPRPQEEPDGDEGLDANERDVDAPRLTFVAGDERALDAHDEDDNEGEVRRAAEAKTAAIADADAGIIDVEVVDEPVQRAQVVVEVRPEALEAVDATEPSRSVEELDAAFDDRVMAGETDRPKPAERGAD
jgi:hypothetical protein